MCKLVSELMCKQAAPCLFPKWHFYFLPRPIILKALHFTPSNSGKHTVFKQENMVKANVANPTEINCEPQHVLMLLFEKCCTCRSVTEDRNTFFLFVFSKMQWRLPEKHEGVFVGKT